jgi:hypothetical protein
LQSSPPPFTDLSSSARPPGSPAAPHRLEAESQGGDAVLSWEPSSGATQFRIFRASHTPNSELGVRELPDSAWLVGPYVAIGTTAQPFYRDNTIVNGRRYNYYVEAVAAGGETSEASNVVMAPSLAPAVTFDQVLAKAAGLARRRQIPAAWSRGLFSRYLVAARTAARRGDGLRAQRFLEALIRQTRRNAGAMEPFVAEDLEILLGRLLRRVTLARTGAIPMWELVNQTGPRGEARAIGNRR